MHVRKEDNSPLSKIKGQLQANRIQPRWSSLVQYVDAASFAHIYHCFLKLWFVDNMLLEPNFNYSNYLSVGKGNDPVGIHLNFCRHGYLHDSKGFGDEGEGGEKSNILLRKWMTHFSLLATQLFQGNQQPSSFISVTFQWLLCSQWICNDQKNSSDLQSTLQSFPRLVYVYLKEEMLFLAENNNICKEEINY